MARLRTAVLPVVGVLAAPVVVAGYVGLTVLTLPVFRLRGLLTSRSP